MLNWTINTELNSTIYSTSETGSDQQSLRTSLEACADKAIGLLNTNIQDDSLYLLFEWNETLATLNIVVTDATKQNDAPQTVSCEFPNVAQLQVDPDQRVANTDSIKFWLHDYLTTCTAFFSYSLVAIFHSSTRKNTELL